MIIPESSVQLTDIYSNETVNKMSFTPTVNDAGKTLTLYVYKKDNDQILYNINTGITVSVEKQNLGSIELRGAGATLTYKGFAQAVKLEGNNAATVAVKDSSNQVINVPTGKTYYELSSTSATNAGDEVNRRSAGLRALRRPERGVRRSYRHTRLHLRPGASARGECMRAHCCAFASTCP